jgi:hypothetical protein
MSAFSFVPDGTFMVCLAGSPSAKALGYFQIKLGCYALAYYFQFWQPAERLCCFTVARSHPDTGRISAL